jgi:ectoine hydroxylase-related dioxygenase (phytanoyl-CoA dioxygenase family)
MCGMLALMAGNTGALTTQERELLPSADDVAEYGRHGWFVAPRLFSDEEIDDALAAVERHHAGERDAEPPTSLHAIDDWRTGSRYQIRLNDYVALTNKRLGVLVRKPIVSAIAARLAGAEQIRLWQSGIVYKEPRVDSPTVTIGWHTDRAYWRTCTSTRMLTAWIALQDCDESMGSVAMVDGSHRWPETEAVKVIRYGRTFLGTDPAELTRRLYDTGMPVELTPMRLRRGQVSFHHCMTLHGSGPNRSDRPRVGITVNLQDGENRYQRVVDAGKVLDHANDRACRARPDGSPDYADPAVCPVLWEARTGRPDGDGPGGL